MQRYSILTLVVVITLVMGACGAKATPAPAISAMDMQSTSAAVALTMIAETQAAIPTATPQPTETITNTSAPTNTFLPMDIPATFTPSGNSGGSEACTETTEMPKVLHGELIKMRINNSTKATMRLSIYLNDPKQCGYRAYNLEPGGALVLTDLVEGCYTLYAWNINPDEYFIVTNGTNCIDSSYPVAFDISKSSLKLR